MKALNGPNTGVIAMEGWDRLPPPIQPLAGQIGLFEYLPRTVETGQCELFDTGRDLPGADEEKQQILWDV
jgi:hypothetical protein